MSTLRQNLGVGVATTLLGLTGGWFMQDSQHKAEMDAQRTASAEEAERQAETLKHQQEEERQLKADQAALDLFLAWQKPDFVEDRRVATALLQGAGTRNYTDIMSHPGTTEREKQALGRTLLFFAGIRGLAAADRDEDRTLNIPKTRQLFGPAALWWSGSGMRVLLQRTREDEVPPEVLDAAYGLSALGYDLTSLAPLPRETVRQFMSLAPALTFAPARFVQVQGNAAQAATTVASAVAEPVVEEDTSASAVNAGYLKCLADAYGEDRRKETMVFEDWLRALDAKHKRELSSRCASRLGGT